MKFLLFIFFTIATAFSSFAAEPNSRPNVLFIAVDDLNHWVGYTGRNPQTKTPNLDRLSKMGVSFMNASCAAPVCNPSRAALMSGMRPGTSGVYDNGQNWKKYIPEGKGLSLAFKQAGYYVAGCGKIYHGNTFYPGEWDDYLEKSGSDAEEHGPKDIDKLEAFHTPLKHDLKDSDLADYHYIDWCAEKLGKKYDKPFFLACGLHKPHLPWVVPKKYYDLFPLESIQLPPHIENDLKDVPPTGVRMAKTSEHKEIVKTDRWKAAVQSYLAAIAYTDMNIGRLLDALEKSAYRENTIIVFWGDHGWHLGEKEHWRKFALWEEAVRAPFIWRVPGMTKPGTICDRTVDFMSIYPTLCELAGIPVPKHVEGKSIKPLLADPKASWTTPGVCTWGYQNHSSRSEQFRYIRYANGDEELYDHTKDPYEWTNLASKVEFNSVKQDLAKWFPTTNVPMKKEKGKASADE